MYGQTSKLHKTIVQNSQSSPTQQFSSGSKRSRSPRRAKLVELDHLKNGEIPRFSRPVWLEGSLPTDRGLHRAWWRTEIGQDITEHLSLLIHCKSLLRLTMNDCIYLIEPVISPHPTIYLVQDPEPVTENQNREGFFFPFPSISSYAVSIYATP